MTFQTATQTTDLDRVDPIRDAVDSRRTRREHWADAETGALVAWAQEGYEGAQLELIARYEPQLRTAANRTRIAPQTDRHQAALTGFLAAVQTYNPAKGVDLYTYAHTKVLAEVRNANREHSPRPAPERNQAYYWSAMDVCDGDACKARHYCGLLRLSISELEPLADSGDTLAREILDKRVDQYDALVLRDEAPEWEEYAARKGRGLDGPTFDAIHATVTYLDAGADLGDGEGDTGHDIVSDPNARDEYTDVDDRIALEQLLGTLVGRERDIMWAHLDGMTDRAIAELTGLSRPRVVNIRKAVVARLRKLAAA